MQAIIRENITLSFKRQRTHKRITDRITGFNKRFMNISFLM